jgi:3'-phosphoadenosine 5'-phosphosulfate sulfotransferase (PAPS reductase)/FAD synthetase
MNEMEMWKAVEETGDKRLQARVKNAYSVIERTLALYKTDEIVFGFSGGKDSTVSELLLLDVISISSLCS